MNCMHRRNFIKSSLLAGGVAAMNPFPHALYASEKKKNANDIIELGNTGVKVSRLAWINCWMPLKKQSDRAVR